MRLLLILSILALTGCKSVALVKGGIAHKESKESGRGNGLSRNTTSTSTGGSPSTGGGSSGGEGNDHGKDHDKGHGHDKHKGHGHDKDKHKGKDK